MLVFNYTLNICPAVGIRVAPIRTSFQTLPPLLLPGFRFLVISSLVYILSPDVYRVPCIFLFFFFPSFFPIHPLSAGRATPVSDYATKTCLLARWIGTCRFSFPLFRRGNGGHGGVLWIVNAHLSSLSWNGVDNDREERERGRKGWSTDIRRFVTVSFIGKIRWELCDDIFDEYAIFYLLQN